MTQKSKVESHKSIVDSHKSIVGDPALNGSATIDHRLSTIDREDREGWQGWDEYAAFYDWENRQTMGRRDVRFWQDMARQHGGPILELGCGTGRVSLPVARTGVEVVGVDRSDQMLDRARRRVRRSRAVAAVRLVRADIRALPFRPRSPFRLVMAPYGILQSLIDDADLTATLQSVARVTRPGTIFGIDLVSDVPAWDEYKRRVRMRGTRPGGTAVTLVESVRQDPSRQLTIFDQEYIERRGSKSRVQRFSLTFRTLPLAQMVERVETAGFAVEAVLGDYDGRPWDLRADAWLILARRRKGRVVA
ncbi:MAG: class I SAM-dependent methyltransferase [Bacteroidales bacterium]